MTTAIYAGSFNPFTIGHADIVERALKIFPRLVIAVGFNEKKPASADDIDRRVAEIASVYDGVEGVEVAKYSGLTVKFADRYPNPVLIRGVRNGADHDAEMQLAEVNRMISGIETLLLPASPQLGCVSSSMVRELRNNGFDISPFLPKRVDVDSANPGRHSCGSSD